MKPFAATNATEFTFQPQGNQTAVTWCMSGKRNFMSKAMSLVMSMEKMIGGQFETGLQQMKAVVETRKIALSRARRLKRLNWLATLLHNQREG